MTASSEMILAAFLLTGLMLTASSRLLHCIRIVAVQGLLLGLLPLVIRNWEIGADQITVSLLNIAVKAVALPWLLMLAMRRAGVRRELEPMIGYSASLLIALALTGVSFAVGTRLHLPGEAIPLAMPVAFSTMLIGLFMVIARRKAITQVIGFLIFENGISLFGIGLMLEYGLAVELGILLDVFVLVFVMGIAVFQISREFEHIDADKLNLLGDWSAPDEPCEEEGGR
ncbi:MAG: hydrogenase [Victivallaceae bacterium]|nr:hypothetical protein [Victivallaceae bacterium]